MSAAIRGRRSAMPATDASSAVVNPTARPIRLPWREAKIVDVVAETPEVRSLVLRVAGWPGHVAGQHVDVRLTAEDGYQAERSYSIASSPKRDELVLTVERIEDGEVSPYLTGEARCGDRFELRGPIGAYFTWMAPGEGPLQLIAGGSGIAPLMSMLRHRAAVGASGAARLLFSSRTFEAIIYREELARLARSENRLAVTHTLTREAPPGWSGERRRVDATMLSDLAFRPADKPQTYICGPTPFVEAVAALLVELGHPPPRIKTERFGPTGGPS
jgi:ferredoxin-NADP reductase